MIMKNLLTIAPATAFGYNWQIRATNMAHATPPRKPFTFEYIARPISLLELLACYSEQWDYVEPRA